MTTVLGLDQVLLFWKYRNLRVEESDWGEQYPETSRGEDKLIIITLINVHVNICRVEKERERVLSVPWISRLLQHYISTNQVFCPQEPSENGPLFSELKFYMRAAKPELSKMHACAITYARTQKSKKNTSYLD